MAKKEAKEWQNRITGYGEESPDQLLANPRNHRIHPKRQQDALSGSLETLGLIQTVIVNKATGHIVDGHLRVTMALREGQTSIPVTYVELTEAEEAQALLSLDPIAAMAANDKDKVDELLRMVNTDNEQVMKHLADFAAENKLDYGQPEPVDAEPQIDRAAEPQIDRAAELAEKWQTKSGQLWKLGEHRLLIGDCTVRENVERLMGGERAKLAPVDPPYNVGFDYDGETVDDQKTEEKYKEFCHAWFGECQRVSEKQIVTAGCYNLPSWLRWFDSYHVGTWIKSNSMTNGRVSRFWCWEPVIFFGEKFGKKRTNDIFDYPIGQQKDVANHPCPKPLKMWEDLIENYSEPNDIIYECFGGSGTTLMACVNTGRICRTLEISEKYGAVILERFLDATGIQPELVNLTSQNE